MGRNGSVQLRQGRTGWPAVQRARNSPLPVDGWSTRSLSLLSRRPRAASLRRLPRCERRCRPTRHSSPADADREDEAGKVGRRDRSEKAYSYTVRPSALAASRSRRALRRNAAAAVIGSRISCTRAAASAASLRRGVAWLSRREKIEEVLPFELVELQGSGDGTDDVVGGARSVAALAGRVILDADASPLGALTATQSGHPPTLAVVGQSRLLQSDSGGARAETSADVGSRSTTPRARASGRRWALPETTSTALSHTGRSMAFHEDETRTLRRRRNR
jgi:hypothetical protein